MDKKESFVRAIFDAAKKVRAKGRRINPAVCAAQAALETGYGTSGLCLRANNVFGIKARSTWAGKRIRMPTREWSRADGWVKIMADFRAYDSVERSIEDYANVIERCSWYRDAAANADEWEEFLRGIMPIPGKEPGWATDPMYFEKVKAIILRFDLARDE